LNLNGDFIQRRFLGELTAKGWLQIRSYALEVGLSFDGPGEIDFLATTSLCLTILALSKVNLGWTGFT